MKTDNASLSKRCLCLILSFCCMVACAVTPAFATEGTCLIEGGSNQEPERIGGSGTGFIEREVSRKLIGSHVFFSWHPDFDDPLYDVYSYYFQAEKTTIDVSLGASYKFISVGVTISLGDTGVSGYSKKVPLSKVWSRPAIYGDLYEVTYCYGLYDFNLNRWITKQDRVRYVTANTDIVIEYNSQKSALE